MPYSGERSRCALAMVANRSNRSLIRETALDIHRYICNRWFAIAQ